VLAAFELADEGAVQAEEVGGLFLAETRLTR
jgi:hypothetical protein